MAISVNILAEQRAVEVAVEGPLSMDLRHQVLSSALFALRANGYFRLLIDVTRTRFGQDESMTDAFKVIAFLRNLGFTPDLRLAFLQPGFDERRQYFEKVAQADGFDLHYFTDREKALRWLTDR